MYPSGADTIKQALIADGGFCAAVGVMMALAANYLDSEIGVTATWMVRTAGIVVAIWGSLLIAAASVLPTRTIVGGVCVANFTCVAAMIAWLAFRRSEMSEIGIAVVVILAVSVLLFAVHQLQVLRAVPTHGN